MDGEEWARQEIMEYERANQMIIRTNTAKAVSWPTLSRHFLGCFHASFINPPSHYPGNHP